MNRLRNLEQLAALGLVVALASACDSRPDPESNDDGLGGGGSGSGGSPAVCTPDGVESSFAPTAGPDRARFKFVAAGPSVVVSSTGNGLHRSVDGGASWAFVDAPELRGKTIVAMAALGSELFVSVDDAVYRSTDDGASWHGVSSGDCIAPTYLSTHGSDLFAIASGHAFHWNGARAEWEALPVPEDFFDVLESDGSYLYANSLYTPGVYSLELANPTAAWVRVEGLPEWGYRAFAFIEGRSFAANATSIFASADGVSWERLETNGDVEVEDFLVLDGAVLAATDHDLRVTVDGGTTWQTPLEDVFQSGFAIASDGTHLFAAGDGLLRATGAVSEWERLHVRADSIVSLVGTKNGVLSLTAEGFMRSTDGGATWKDVELPEPGILAWSSPLVTHHEKLFALAAGEGLLVSSDEGASFARLSTPGVDTGWTSLLDATGDTLIVGVSTGAGNYCEDVQDVTTTLFVSTDEGATWQKKMNHFPTTFVDCYDVAYSPMITEIAESGGVLLASTAHTGAFRSDDLGESWQPIQTSPELGSLRGFVESDGEVFAASDLGGVARSRDGGVTWSRLTIDGMVSVLLPVAAAIFATVGSDGAKDAGVFVTTDGGETWSRADATFDSRVGPIAAQGLDVFVGTQDESVWTTKLSCSDP